MSNLRGEKFRVLVADSFQCSEGVSFFAVRRVFFADVPLSPSQLVQQCGRSIRMFGHQGLPEEEQVVVNHMYQVLFMEGPGRVEQDGWTGGQQIDRAEMLRVVLQRAMLTRAAC